MFGAWQAGAWSTLAGRFTPDLVVGASVGSLNGYLIASGIPPAEFLEYWLDPRFSRLRDLEANVQLLTQRYQPSTPFAVTMTDILRLKPRVVSGPAVTWRHLLASCAIPIVRPQVKIEGRWSTDGGLLNPLPVWAAVELGATRIVGLNALPEIPSAVLRPFVKAFRWTFGHNPPLPPGVALDVLAPSQRLGSMRDAIRWRRGNIERWYALGASDAARFLEGG
jgi:predicted acylesterase/phospholipase RssA